MKKLLISLAGLVLLSFPVTAMADTLTFQAPATASNQGEGGARQFDLDHFRAYAWRIDNINLAGKTITGATITFSNIRNWDANTNRLFVHLLDSARQAGVSSFQDSNNANDTIQDNFGGSLYNSNPLVNAGTGNTLLTSRSFSTTPTNFVYNFTAAQVQALAAYIANGNNIAFGFDPDCHFWNNGITFQIQTSQTPEPTTLALLGTGVVGFIIKRRRRKQVAA